jgi:hypothetical protein
MSTLPLLGTKEMVSQTRFRGGFFASFGSRSTVFWHPCHISFAFGFMPCLNFPFLYKEPRLTLIRYFLFRLPSPINGFTLDSFLRHLCLIYITTTKGTPYTVARIIEFLPPSAAKRSQLSKRKESKEPHVRLALFYRPTEVRTVDQLYERALQSLIDANVLPVSRLILAFNLSLCTDLPRFQADRRMIIDF